jgi:hypothetical protein
LTQAVSGGDSRGRSNGRGQDTVYFFSIYSFRLPPQPAMILPEALVRSTLGSVDTKSVPETLRCFGRREFFFRVSGLSGPTPMRSAWEITLSPWRNQIAAQRNKFCNWTGAPAFEAALADCLGRREISPEPYTRAAGSCQLQFRLAVKSVKHLTSDSLIHLRRFL